MNKKLKDSWSNVLNGLGGKRDATTNTTYKGVNNDS